MQTLAFFNGQLVLSPAPFATLQQRREFAYSLTHFQRGQCDELLAELVAIAKLCEPLFTAHAEHAGITKNVIHR